MTDLWTATLPLDRLDEAAAVVARTVSSSAKAPFCIWLQGDLGAGKTTLTGAILRALGLSPAVPVTSPTYTYMNEYKIGTKWYAHLDLYRAGAALGLEDLGLVDTRPFAGYFVEWPEQIPASPALTPTHRLRIEFAADGAERSYRLEELSA